MRERPDRVLVCSDTTPLWAPRLLRQTLHLPSPTSRRDCGTTTAACRRGKPRYHRSLLRHVLLPHPDRCRQPVTRRDCRESTWSANVRLAPYYIHSTNLEALEGEVRPQEYAVIGAPACQHRRHRPRADAILKALGRSLSCHLSCPSQAAKRCWRASSPCRATCASSSRWGTATCCCWRGMPAAS
jgi:hypothetical protein